MPNSFTATATTTSPTVTLTPPGTFDTSAASITDVKGHYASEQDLIDLFGATNVYAWSSLDGTGERNPARILRALQWADAEIDGKLAGGIHALTPHLDLLNDAATNTIGKDATILAMSDLRNSRGLRDDGENKPTDQYSAMVDDVYKELGLIKAGVLQLNATRIANAGSTGPTVVSYGW